MKKLRRVNTNIRGHARQSFGRVVLALAAPWLASCGDDAFTGGACDYGGGCEHVARSEDCYFAGGFHDGMKCPSLGYETACEYEGETIYLDDESECPAAGESGDGSGGSSDGPNQSSAAERSQPDFSEHSVLCYEVTQTSTGENISVNCTPDRSLTCADLGLQASEYIYTDRATCLDEASKVLEFWVSNGYVGGSESNVDCVVFDTDIGRCEVYPVPDDCSVWNEDENICENWIDNGPDDDGGGGGAICSAYQDFADDFGTGVICTEAPCSETAGSVQSWEAGRCDSDEVLYGCCDIPGGLRAHVYEGCDTGNCDGLDDWNATCSQLGGVGVSGACP